MKALAIAAAIVLIAAPTLPAKAQTATTTNICDRTPVVRDAILWKVQGTNCAAVDLASVTGKLYLRRAKLTTLPAGVFDGLDNLESLSLGNQSALRVYELCDRNLRLRSMGMSGGSFPPSDIGET